MQPLKAKLYTILKENAAVLLCGQWYKTNMFFQDSSNRTLNSFQASSTTFYAFLCVLATIVICKHSENGL